MHARAVEQETPRNRVFCTGRGTASGRQVLPFELSAIAFCLPDTVNPTAIHELLDGQETE
jgi:hypothetical protein